MKHFKNRCTGSRNFYYIQPFYGGRWLFAFINWKSKITMKKQKMLWFQDDLKLGARKSCWQRIDSLTGALVRAVGHPNMDHEIVDPRPHISALAEKLPRDATCVIDLTNGQLMGVLSGLFESSTLVTGFHLSRLRVVSSARLDGSGFMLNKTVREFAALPSLIDTFRTVILDDVGWSGRSALEVCRLFGLPVAQTTFGFVMGNAGEFGPSPGAVNLLQSLGGRVVTGGLVATPRDDGFHVSDFCSTNNISHSELIEALLVIQSLREHAAQFPGESKEVEKRIMQLFKEARDLLFPNALSSTMIKELMREGKVICMNGIPKDALFQTNPLNWLLPSFAKRVRSEDLQQNLAIVIGSLDELRAIKEEGNVQGIEGNFLNMEMRL
jgi:hypothetical protein